VPGRIGLWLWLITSPSPEELADGKPRPMSLKPKTGQYHAETGIIVKAIAIMLTAASINPLDRLIAPAQT
jgi:hypothetical protein